MNEIIGNRSGEVDGKKENMYLELINLCRESADRIRLKARIIICPQVCKDEAETPTRTELEGNLKQLVNLLVDLERDIII